MCFLHSDDEWVPGRLDVQLAAIAVDNQAVVGGSCRYDDLIEADPLPGARLRDFLMHRFGVHISPYLFPVDLLRTDGFDEALRAWEDWDLLLRLRLEGHLFITVPDVVATVLSGAEDRLTQSNEGARALGYLYEKYGSQLQRSDRAIWEFKLALNWRRVGNEGAARQWFWRLPADGTLASSATPEGSLRQAVGAAGSFPVATRSRHRRRIRVVTRSPGLSLAERTGRSDV
jgi:hypothetical protein